MSARRHSIAAPGAGAGRLAAVLGVGRVATGADAPGGQDESDVQINEDIFTKQEACRETLLRFMTDRMNRFCIENGIDASTEMAAVVVECVDILSTVGKDGQFLASSTEVMELLIANIEALGSLHVSIAELPDGKYESAMQALSDAVTEIRQFIIRSVGRRPH